MEREENEESRARQALPVNQGHKVHQANRGFPVKDYQEHREHREHRDNQERQEHRGNQDNKTPGHLAGPCWNGRPYCPLPGRLETQFATVLVIAPATEADPEALGPRPRQHAERNAGIARHGHQRHRRKTGAGVDADSGLIGREASRCGSPLAGINSGGNFVPSEPSGHWTNSRKARWPAQPRSKLNPARIRRLPVNSATLGTNRPS